MGLWEARLTEGRSHSGNGSGTRGSAVTGWLGVAKPHGCDTAPKRPEGHHPGQTVHPRQGRTGQDGAGGRLTARAVVRPAIQHHSLLGTGPGVLQEGRARALQLPSTLTRSLLTQGHERLGIHQRVAAGKHRGALQKLALLPQALQEEGPPQRYAPLVSP